MVIYALQINSFPQIKGAFSRVGEKYEYSTKARKGELEIAFLSGINYTIKYEDDEVYFNDGDIVINMPDIGFEGKSEEVKVYNSSSVIAQLDDYVFEMYDVKSPGEWRDVKSKTERKILIPRYIPNGKVTDMLKIHINKLVMNFMLGDMTSELESVGILCSIFAILDGYVRKIMDEQSLNGIDTSEAYMKKIKAYVDKYYSQKLQISDVAKVVNASISYVGKIIKKCTGKTFVEYVNYTRVERARRIFSSDDKITAEKVAEMVGFCDERYMNLMFKKVTGFNVRECRKMDSVSLISLVGNDNV
jgi:YesN/AraC family two-component response regulator